MKQFIRTTYAFENNPQGNAPDEAGPRREILDTINLLSLGELSGPDARAVAAIGQNSFTAAQYIRVREIIETEINAKRLRIANLMRNDQHQGPALRAYWPERVKELDGIEHRWRQTDRDIVALLSKSTVVVVTGLEPNNDERHAARKPASEHA